MSEQISSLSLFATMVLLVGCGATSKHLNEPAVADCGDAPAVRLDDAQRTGGVFTRLLGTHRAKLVFACPDQGTCALPPDSELSFTIAPERAGACEFASCRAPYLGALPFARAGDESCPNVLWTRAEVRLHSDAGALDEQAHDVNVLAHADGEGVLRFMVERAPGPREREGSSPLATGPGRALSILLDVQLEATPERIRGQLSALAAPLDAEPSTELRYKALWTATWETPAAQP
jgi:hypothetical protein